MVSKFGHHIGYVRAADNLHTVKSFLYEYRRTGETDTLTAVHEVRIPEYQRQQHTYLIGATRYGKSELIKALIHSYSQRDMAAVILIDPAGDLAQQVAKFPEIGKRLVYFHPRLSKYHTPTINPLETNARKEDKQVIAQQILEAFTEVIAGGLGSAVSLPMRALLMPCILTLMDRPGSTFLDLQRFMRDAPELISLGERSLYPAVSSFFREEFRDKRFTITKGSISTKLQELFNSGYFVDLTCGQSTVDLADAIRKKKIVIFNLSKSSIGPLESQAFGRLVVSYILSIALRGNRTHTHLMIDECHNFLTPSIRTILLEAGKFNLYLTLIQQIVGDHMSPEMRSVVTGSCNLRITAYQHNLHQAEAAKLLGTEPADIARLRKGQYIMSVGQQRPFMFHGRRDLLNNTHAVPPAAWQSILTRQLALYYRTKGSPSPPPPPPPTSGFDADIV